MGGTKCCKLLALAGNAGLGLIGGEVDLDSPDSWTLGFRFSGFLDPWIWILRILTVSDSDSLLDETMLGALLRNGRM